MPSRRPRFSMMLVERRRRLGLSISQASQVLRLKEQVLVAFEEGDFDRIPKSGYAQGMLASYARYLGLDARQIGEQFSADLRDYLRSSGEQGEHRSRQAQRDSSSSARMLPLGSSAYGQPYRGARGLLPTSGGPAGDLGAFATTSQPRRHQRGQVVSTAGYDYDDVVPAPAPIPSGRPVPSSVETQRRYTTRTPSGGTRPRAPRGTERVRARAGRGPGSGVTQRANPDRDRVTSRRVRSGEYVDDLRYGDARPFEAASTRSGRSSSRNIASTRRPNVQRRNSTASRRTPARRGGLAGVIDGFFGDPGRALLLVVIVAALLLTVIVVSSVRSCIANQNSTGRRTVEVAQSEQREDAGERQSEDTAKEDAQALADAAAAKKPEEIPKETVVEVSVADGMVSWVEIQCDGQSEFAETVTGPWEQSYTVEDSITIRVGDTSSVTVTENGEQRRFDAHALGIGSITIQSAAKAADDDSADEGGEQGQDDPDVAGEDGSL